MVDFVSLLLCCLVENVAWHLQICNGLFYSGERIVVHGPLVSCCAAIIITYWLNWSQVGMNAINHLTISALDSFFLSLFDPELQVTCGNA